MNLTEATVRLLIREAIIASMDEKEIMGLNFPDLTRGLAIAKRVAAGRPMGFVRDVGDAYVYAAIGGILDVGPSYAPDLFVCIHDGMRADKKTLGFKFEPGAAGWRPKDVVDAMSNISAGDSAAVMVRSAATALFDEYAGRNTYQYIVDKVKNGSLPAGSAGAVVASPPAPATDAPPAAAAESAEGAADLVADLGALIDAGRAQASTDLGGGRMTAFTGPPATSVGGGASAPAKRGIGSWFKGKLKREPKARPEAGEPQETAGRKQKTATSRSKLYSGGSERLIYSVFTPRLGGSRVIIRDAISTLRSPEYSDVKMQDLLKTPPSAMSREWSALADPGESMTVLGVPARAYVSKLEFVKHFNTMQDDFTPLLDYVSSAAQEAVGSDDAYTRDVGLILSQYPALFTIVSRVANVTLPTYDSIAQRYTGINPKVFPVFAAAAEQLALTLPDPRASATSGVTFGSAVMEPQSAARRK